ncbi:MAG: helix-turn-helix domain-containing protein [Phyllobacterium sp.]|jgi:transcriptional regulator with XRE-family HTH domain|uniref:Helix-turn-helix transcriptional regulator n=1 Tax=Phyllobacterium pellucidum TaxID=2740464 RepID=A0A849VP85_9HYPH|nr:MULTISPECIES: helix-turn-helix domain-containing protein [Phyllobacterium]MRG54145.1 helix-turn-helix domain-containing protein [Phyllobacterium sp. SYP-B3895]NTS30844.1 helix-turn-helix transcriptional regulator [Phyllobacterium pellucidum]UGY10546.1 helix-turn-helix domain-containing protein [Phyllobacterium sp. T1018]SDP80269.1 transcriptional regulator [Phyllobacterium sp. YR620]SFI63557.1 Transcriptional regulator, contains XRE-family HTH domain [Phyllobacterium sp. CL33Tsu]
MSDNKKRPNPVDVHVGARIRLRRNMIGLSQEKLGDSLGITFQQIQKYEKGMNRVGASRLQAIGNVLNVPVTFFFDDMPGQDDKPKGFDEESETTYVVGLLNSSEGIQLARAFAKITDAKVRRKILDLVRTLGLEED